MTIDEGVLSWLLEDDAPAVAYLTRTWLLGEPADSDSMRALRRRANEVGPVAEILERLDESLELSSYNKYRGAFWTLIFLAEMHADPNDPRVRRLAEHVLERQQPSGGFALYRKKPKWETVCLTANLLRSLVHCGYGDDDRVAHGYRRLAERIVGHDGVPCFVVDDFSLMPSCRMTLPQTLRAVAAAPAALADDVAELRAILVGQLLEMRLYRYVRPDAKHFYDEVVPNRPKGTTFKRAKKEYLALAPSSPEEWLPKKPWLKLGFPSSYNPDLLEALLALAELGVPRQDVLDEPLDRIEELRDADGRWRMDRSLNGKTLVDVERKGEPSKWITLRALRVLRHFGRRGLR